MITINTADGPMQAYRADPEKSRGSALVVFQEAFGVNGYIRSVVDRLAKEGYVAVAPELFHRSGDGQVSPYEQIESALGMVGALTDDMIAADVDASVAYLADEVGAGHVGVIGFCFGGRVAFMAACRAPVAAVASLYGGGVGGARPGFRALIEDAHPGMAPTLAIFGDADEHIPSDQVERVRTRLGELGDAHQVKVYEGAGHAFHCDEGPTYHPEAAADAWQRSLEWFEQHKL
jgi:carboxymethylenebutenolidase